MNNFLIKRENEFSLKLKKDKKERKRERDFQWKRSKEGKQPQEIDNMTGWSYMQKSLGKDRLDMI